MTRQRADSAERLEERRRRISVANTMLEVISEHGRRFFHHDGRVSRFEMDERGRVWFVDKYTGRRIWTHQEGAWSRRYFTEGGTLLDLCKALRDYIMGRRGTLPLRHLGPWPQEFCGGDVWGYGDAMATVRELCTALDRGHNHA